MHTPTILRAQSAQPIFPSRYRFIRTAGCGRRRQTTSLSVDYASRKLCSRLPVPISFALSCRVSVQQCDYGRGHGSPFLGQFSGCSTGLPGEHTAWLCLGNTPEPSTRLAGHVPQRLWPPAGLSCCKLRNLCSMQQCPGMHTASPHLHYLICFAES